MKKYNYFYWIIIFLFISCNSGQSQQTKPEKVYRIVYEVYPNDWYMKQAQLWKKEIEKNPQNAEAWHNYYNAHRYANFKNLDTKDKKEKLQQIINDMGKAIPETYEYYLLKYKNKSDISEIALIEKAHQLKPDEAEPLYDLICYNEIHGNTDKVREFYEKLYQSQDIAPWLLDYNYNVLMSTENNAIIITNGDNDTYPAEMLQLVKHVRNDVTIINVGLSAVQSYLKNKLQPKGLKFDFTDFKKTYFGPAERPSHRYLSEKLMQDLCETITKDHPEIPIYFALTVYKNHINTIMDNLYIVGLVYQYSPQRIDNLALLKKNLEENFRLDYLNYDWYADLVPGERLMATMHMNYAAITLMLAEHYKTSGENEKAKKWKNIALDLARKADNQKLIEEIEKKWL